MIQAKGRRAWQEAVGHGQRPYAETAMSRYETIIGHRLRAHTLSDQTTKAKAACPVLNRTPGLGMPAYQRIRRKPLGIGWHVYKYSSGSLRSFRRDGTVNTVNFQDFVTI